MHRLAFVPFLATMLASATVAAQPAVPASPAAAAPASAAAAPYQKVVEGRAVVDYPLPSSTDPRVCLEFATQAQVIACAEKYRRKARGG
jgi:hypothetical protein